MNQPILEAGAAVRVALSLVAATGAVCVSGSTAYAATRSASSSPWTQPSPTPVSLQQLLPADVNAGSCEDRTASTKAVLAGLQTRLLCKTTDTSGVQVDAFQFDSPEHYNSALQTINVTVNYNAAQATGNCPPAANAQGKSDWWSEANPAFAKKPGQYVECFSFSKDGTYNYLYTVPSHNTVIWAFTLSGWQALDAWWKQYVIGSASPTAG